MANLPIKGAAPNYQSYNDYRPKAVTDNNNSGKVNLGFTAHTGNYVKQNNTGGDSSGGGYDYASAMMDLLKAQYDAQERARQAKLEALYKSNNESADRQVGLLNNQANRNNKQIANLTKGGTNGAMLSSQLQNNLWRDNGIHDTINARDIANANEESASFNTQASNLGNYINGVNSVMANLGALDTDAQRKLISRLEDIYR